MFIDRFGEVEISKFVVIAWGGGTVHPNGESMDTSKTVKDSRFGVFRLFNDNCPIAVLSVVSSNDTGGPAVDFANRDVGKVSGTKS